MRLARVVFAHGVRPRSTVRVDGPDEHDALDALGDRRVERLLHELGVETELPVRHADQVDERVDAARRGAHRRRVVRVPRHDFGERVAPDLPLERLARASDRAVLAPEPAQRVRDAPADLPSASEQRHLSHLARLLARRTAVS